MWHLYRSELLRFRGLALGLAIGHLVILRGLVEYYFEFLAQDASKTAIGLLVYSTSGFLFGVYQIGTYRQSSRWTYLMHRPLPAARIFASLSLSATSVLAVAFTLPMILMTSYVDLLTVQIVDLRQYLLPFFLLGLLISFYLAGCFVVLNPSRAAFLVLVLPTFFLTYEASGLWIFLVQWLVISWLYLLNRTAFQPNIETQPKGTVGLTLTVLPIAYSVFCLLVLGSNLLLDPIVAISDRGLGEWRSFTWSKYLTTNDFEAAVNLESKALFRSALETGDSEDLEFLSRQVQLAEDHRLKGASFPRYPVRHQLMFVDHRFELDEFEETIRWTFSHDEMMFHGRNARNGESVGWLGPEGRVDRSAGLKPTAPRFVEMPYVLGNRYLLTRHRLYELDSRRDHLFLRFEVDGSERLTSGFQDFGSFLTLNSDRSLYFFEPRDLERKERVQAMAEVDLPGWVHNLARIDIVELIDGFLISFVLGEESGRDFHEALQVVGEVDVHGKYQLLVERELSRGVPAWHRHRGFLLSPFLQTGGDLINAQIKPHQEERVGFRDLVENPPPPGRVLLAIAMGLSSTLMVFAFARYWATDRETRNRWLVLTLVLGVPGLVCFLLLCQRNSRAVLTDLSLQFPLPKNSIPLLGVTG